MREVAERRSKYAAFGLTWVAYATYYVGRKGFGVVKKPLSAELGFGVSELALIDTAFLAAYTIGQFGSGWLGDRVGARRLVAYGMLASAAACAAFGSSSAALVLVACFVVNGLAQSTGWPGTTRAMAEWTTPAERGTVMGLWSTCYQVGGVGATWLAGEVAERFGWRASFQVAALCLFGVGLIVLGFLRSPPAAGRGAGAAVTAGDAAAPVSATDVAEQRAAQLAVVRNVRLWLYGASYFFIKLIRYALLFWLPYYLSERFGYSTGDAARLSTAFDAGGIVGVIAIGRASDRVPRLSRAAWSALALLLLSAALVGYVLVGDAGATSNALLLALIGALLFGPDALLSGAAAQDAGGVHAPAMATGFVNGVGSAGALLQGAIVPAIAARFGWQALFPAFVAFALCAALALVPTLGKARVH